MSALLTAEAPEEVCQRINGVMQAPDRSIQPFNVDGVDFYHGVIEAGFGVFHQMVHLQNHLL